MAKNHEASVGSGENELVESRRNYFTWVGYPEEVTRERYAEHVEKARALGGIQDAARVESIALYETGPITVRKKDKATGEITESVKPTKYIAGIAWGILNSTPVGQEPEKIGDVLQISGQELVVDAARMQSMNLAPPGTNWQWPEGAHIVNQWTISGDPVEFPGPISQG